MTTYSAGSLESVTHVQVIRDFKLPGIDGYTLLNALHGALEGSPGPCAPSRSRPGLPRRDGQPNALEAFTVNRLLGGEECTTTGSQSLSVPPRMQIPNHPSGSSKSQAPFPFRLPQLIPADAPRDRCVGLRPRALGPIPVGAFEASTGEGYQPVPRKGFSGKDSIGVGRLQTAYGFEAGPLPAS